MFNTSKIEKAVSAAAPYAGNQEYQIKVLARELRDRGMQPETVWSQATSALAKANAALNAERVHIGPDSYNRRGIMRDRYAHVRFA